MTRKTPLLGLSERWSLARNNVGSPITVIYHASLPANLLTQEDLENAVRQLCETYPILLCHVEGKTSKKPSYANAGDVKVEDIVKVVELESHYTLAELQGAAARRGAQFDPAVAPLLEVQLLQSLSPHENASDRLVLLIDHILCDGVGAKNLFADLLGLLSGVPIPAQPHGLPTRIDDQVDLNPDSASTSVSLLGRLRKYIDSALQWYGSTSNSSPTPFPGRPAPEYNSLDAGQRFSLLEIPQSQLSSLLSTGKQYRIPTIHPVIHVACLTALYRSLSPAATPLSFLTSVPISERKAESGDPRSTGNYVTFYFPTNIISQSTRFWDFVRDFSTALRQPETKIAARRALGQFALIDETINANDDGNSGWEEYLNRLIHDSNGPHKLALAVSNVGRMELPVEGRLAGHVRDVYFSQSASAVGAAAVVSIMSAQGGPLTISISSKAGALSPGVLETFTLQLRATLQAIARGDLSIVCTAGGSIPGVPDILPQTA